MNAPENKGRHQRIPPSIAKKIQEAADLTGTTMDQFMIHASLEKAEKIIDREKNLYFSKNDAAMLIELLDHPPPPNEAMTKALERFKARELENGSPNSPAGEDA